MSRAPRTQPAAAPRYRPDPLHEARIQRELAEHHDRRAAETTGEERADHRRAAESCRARAAEWMGRK